MRNNADRLNRVRRSYCFFRLFPLGKSQKLKAHRRIIETVRIARIVRAPFENESRTSSLNPTMSERMQMDQPWTFSIKRTLSACTCSAHIAVANKWNTPKQREEIETNRKNAWCGTMWNVKLKEMTRTKWFCKIVYSNCVRFVRLCFTCLGCNSLLDCLATTFCFGYSELWKAFHERFVCCDAKESVLWKDGKNAKRIIY